MIEPIIYMAIGFLLSALLGLMLLPLVHNRAVRLTTKRLEASAPVSMTEVQADKDQLRAEFAMSARKLEMSIDQPGCGTRQEGRRRQPPEGGTERAER